MVGYDDEQTPEPGRDRVGQARPEEPRPLPEEEPLPTFPGGEDFDVMEILSKYIGQPVTPELLQQMASDFAALELYNQFRQLDYQDSYLEYLENQLGLNQAELDLAKKHLEFQEGPYWEWYTGPYFEHIKQQSANEVAISDAQRDSARYAARSSQFRSMSDFYNASAQAIMLNRQLAEDPRGIRESPMRFGAPVGVGY